MVRMRPLALAMLLAAAATPAPAGAALSIVAGIGGAPTGVNRSNLDHLTLGATAPQMIAPGVMLSLVPDAAVVQGSLSGRYAAPFLSGANGAGFGAGGGTQANGADATPYLSTGSTGAFAGAGITISFAAPQSYFGLLWGSVDTYNTLSFFSGATLLGSITGGQVTPQATGNQGAQGTFYVNINSGLAFDRVVATSSQYAFEFDNLAWSAAPVGVPEPAALAMLAAGLAGLGLALYLRRQRRAV